MNALAGLRRIPLAVPIGSVMQRISLAWFADLGSVLGTVANSARVNELTILDLYRLQVPLNILSQETTYPLDLRASRPVIHHILGMINYVLNE